MDDLGIVQMRDVETHMRMWSQEVMYLEGFAEGLSRCGL